MEQIYQWGLDFIRAVQFIASPQLTFVMRIITQAGGAPLYFIPLLLIWCIDEKKGLRLGLAVLISTWINMSLKYLFDQPRPFFEGYDPSVGMISASMGGLPSGHAQNSMVFLFIIASWLKNKWAYVSAGFLCLLISFTRIYLGVHFPADIAAGWILGGIILFGYFYFSDKIEMFIVKGGFRTGMFFSSALSLIMIIYLPGKEMLMPGGVILGLGIGYCFNKRYVGFKSGALYDRTGIHKYLTLFARLLIGTAGFSLLFYTAARIIPQDSANYNLYAFIQIAVCGFWVSAAAPWIFIKLCLAEAQSLVIFEQKENEQ